MFLISRMKDESVVLGDDIILTVIEIRGDKVRLGIELPEGVSLHRAEMYDALHHPEHDRAMAAHETSERGEG